MWQFLSGIGIGIYIGTYYNCKPGLEFMINAVKTNIPEKRDDESD